MPHPYFFIDHPIAMVLFDGTLAVWAATEFRQALRRRPEATTRDYGSRFVIVLFAAGGFLLAALARSKVTTVAFPSDAITFGIGLAIIWAGVGLRWWSFRTLGRYFTIDVMTSADQPVISTGPYRFLRHPSYAALLLILVGIGIMSANWLSLAAVILLPLLGDASHARRGSRPFRHARRHLPLLRRHPQAPHPVHLVTAPTTSPKPPNSPAMRSSHGLSPCLRTRTTSPNSHTAPPSQPQGNDPSAVSARRTKGALPPHRAKWMSTNQPCIP